MLADLPRETRFGCIGFGATNVDCLCCQLFRISPCPPRKIRARTKTHDDGVLVPLVGSFLCVIAPHGVLLFHSVSAIYFCLRARVEVWADSGLHCLALSLPVSCAQKPCAMTVSPAPTKRSTTCGTLCWIRSSNTSQDTCCYLPRKHGGSQIGSHCQIRSGRHVVVRRPPVNSSVFPSVVCKRHGLREPSHFFEAETASFPGSLEVAAV